MRVLRLDLALAKLISKNLLKGPRAGLVCCRAGGDEQQQDQPKPEVLGLATLASSVVSTWPRR